jgi:WD40 repeat protein/predicted Ser/Thr protein kinase
LAINSYYWQPDVDCMTLQQTCHKCGVGLRGVALEGLCGKCLARLAFEPGGESEKLVAGFRSFSFGDYELIEEIARGGMGVVYKATQKSLNRLVALKMILHGPFSSAEFVRRFQSEAEMIARLHHPNIVSIYEVGESDGQHYLSMEYIHGQNLAEVARDKPLDARRAAVYVQTIAQAIDYAHQAGVVHRDLKPSNLLLDVLDQPHITDFGLAKLAASDSNLTVTGQMLGSPGYMAPERADGGAVRNEVAGDIYSLGAVLFHLLTTRPPFQGATLQEVFWQVQNAEPLSPRRLNPGVPPDLETICLKCLQKEPAKRYESAKELANDLARFLAGEPIHARPVSSVEQLWSWCRRHPRQTALSAALAVAVAAGLAGILWEWRQAEINARGEARERQNAQEYAQAMRLNLYAADINLAARALERGDSGRARLALAALQPKPGEQDLRGFEWRYLKALSQGDQLTTLTGHTWIVTCAAFSPDGHRLVTGSQDGTAKLWDVVQHKLLHTFGNGTGAVWSCGFSPDGSLLVLAGTLRPLELWDVEKLTRVGTFPGQLAVLSKTASLMVTTESNPFYWEPAGKVTLWNYRTAEKLRELERPGRALALSPDGATLATAGSANSVDLWEADSGKLLRTLVTDNSVWSLAFSPDGGHLITAGWTSEALVWDLNSNLPPGKLSGHVRNVWSATYSPDGSTVATTSSDQTIRLWDSATLQLRNILRGHGNEVWCGAFSPDGRLLATGGKDQTVRLWAAEPLVQRQRVPHRSGSRPLFSPDGKQMAVVAYSGTEWRPQLWDVEKGALVVNLPEPAAIGFSPDGKYVIRLNEPGMALEFWSPNEQTAKPVRLEGLKPTIAAFEKMGFSPAWETFFAIDASGLIRVWHTSDGKLLNSVSGPAPPLRSAALGPGGQFLAVTLENENIARLYETQSARLTRLTGHRDFVSGLGFSPDGRMLATGSMDGTVKLWDVGTGAELATLAGHMEEATDVAFSPDGRTLASVGHREMLIFWHVQTRRELLSIEKPNAGMFLQFSPDGRHLAVSEDGDAVSLLDAPPVQ